MTQERETIICSVENLPIIIAGLVREGVTFEAIKTEHHYVENAYQIKLTGGY